MVVSLNRPNEITWKCEFIQAFQSLKLKIILSQLAIISATVCIMSALQRYHNRAIASLIYKSILSSMNAYKSMNVEVYQLILEESYGIKRNQLAWAIFEEIRISEAKILVYQDKLGKFWTKAEIQ